MRHLSRWRDTRCEASTHVAITVGITIVTACTVTRNWRVYSLRQF